MTIYVNSVRKRFGTRKAPFATAFKMKLGSAAPEHVRVLRDCRVNAFSLFQDAAPILTNELKGQLETQTAICFFKKKKWGGREGRKKPHKAVFIQAALDTTELYLQVHA